MEKIAIYDLDRTITRIGTYTPFLLFAAKRRPLRLLAMPFYFLAMPLYAMGLIKRRSLKQLGFRLAVGGRVPAQRGEALAQDYAAHVMTNNLHPHIVARIEEDRASGFTLAIATAAPDIYAARLGALLGFDHVLATRQERTQSGDFLHRIAGENCYGAEKLRIVEEWLPVPRSEALIRFYSDHHSDAPVFAWCDEPFVANPKARMQALAEAQGWTVLRAQ